VADLFLEAENVLSMLTFITKNQQNVNISGAKCKTNGIIEPAVP
jgi:hypothetical protein